MSGRTIKVWAEMPKRKMDPARWWLRLDKDVPAHWVGYKAATLIIPGPKKRKVAPKPRNRCEALKGRSRSLST